MAGYHSSSQYLQQADTYYDTLLGFDSSKHRDLIAITDHVKAVMNCKSLYSYPTLRSRENCRRYVPADGREKEGCSLAPVGSDWQVVGPQTRALSRIKT